MGEGTNPLLWWEEHFYRDMFCIQIENRHIAKFVWPIVFLKNITYFLK